VVRLVAVAFGSGNPSPAAVYASADLPTSPPNSPRATPRRASLESKQRHADAAVAGPVVPVASCPRDARKLPLLGCRKPASAGFLFQCQCEAKPALCSVARRAGERFEIPGSFLPAPDLGSSSWWRQTTDHANYLRETEQSPSKLQATVNVVRRAGD